MTRGRAAWVRPWQGKSKPPTPESAAPRAPRAGYRLAPRVYNSTNPSLTLWRTGWPCGYSTERRELTPAAPWARNDQRAKSVRAAVVTKAMTADRRLGAGRDS